MHTVSELNTFRNAAEAAGMSEEDITALIGFLSENPDAGDEIPASGGCRKVRFSIRGNNKGKSGGVRTITFYSGETMPVYLLAVFAKSQKITLTKAECKALKQLTEAIKQEHSKRVFRLDKEGTTG